MDNKIRQLVAPAPDRSGVQAAHLRKVLNLMFPRSYVKLYHRPPHSVCTIFRTKTARECARNGSGDSGDDVDVGQGLPNHDGESWASYEASSEPAGRAQVLGLQQQLQDSLAEHQAKPVGLCPVRRAIYDQCFDELIRQVTVGCVEQGLLLFQVRNELRLTANYYRRAYESAVGYGLRKALDAKLQLEASREKIEHLERLVKVRVDQGQGIGDDHHEEHLAGPKPRSRASLKDEMSQVDRIREFYESQLARKDEVIAQQRDVIKALGQK